LVVSPSFAQAFLPLFGHLSALEWSALALGLGGVVLFGTGRVLDRRSVEIMRRIDYPGVLLTGGVLTAIVLAFSTSDPSRSALPHGMTWVALGIVGALGAFVLVERKMPNPLVPFKAFSTANAWGSLWPVFPLA
jgi:uncharacterized membrane protein YjfL (UPF0719 family)